MRRVPALFALLALFPILAGAPGRARAAEIVVDSLTDDGAGCTLREAAESANTDSAVGGCAAGDDTSDRISFSVSGTIILASPITITESVTIQGPDPEQSRDRIIVKVTGNFRSITLNSATDDQNSNLNELTFGGSTGGTGGGILVTAGDSVFLRGCIFKRCAAGSGGAVDASGGAVHATMTLFAGNIAHSGNGGAVRVAGGHVEVRDCTFSGNTAAGQGGALWADILAGVYGSTFTGNRAGALGGAIFLDSATATVANTILWGDDAPQDPEISSWDTGLTVAHSDVQGGTSWPGTGNMNEDPLFVRRVAAAKAPTTRGDYHIRHTSPCVGAGSAAYIGGDYDIDRDQRELDGGVDIGSDEAGPLYNDSFEYGTGVPGPWKGVNLTSADVRVCSTRAFGRCSFRFAGTPAAKSLKQVVPFSGVAGEVIRVRIWERGQGTLPGGVHGLAAKLRYTDGTFGRLAINLASGTHGWTWGEDALSAAKDFNGVILYLKYAKQAGYSWFDGIHVQID